MIRLAHAQAAASDLEQLINACKHELQDDLEAELIVGLAIHNTRQVVRLLNSARVQMEKTQPLRGEAK